MEKKPKKTKTEEKKHRVNVAGSGDQRITGKTASVYEEILSDPRIRFIYMVDSLLRAYSLGYIPNQHKNIVLQFISTFAKADNADKIKELDRFKDDKSFKSVCAIVHQKARERELPTSPFNTCNLMLNDKAWPIYKRMALQGALKFFILAHDRLLRDVVNDNRSYVQDMKEIVVKSEQNKDRNNLHGFVGSFAEIKLTKREIVGPITVVDEDTITAAKILTDIHPRISFVFSPRELVYIKYPFSIMAFEQSDSHPSLNLEYKLSMYKDYTCNIGGKYYITRKGLDEDTVTTSFLSKTLEVTYFMNVPRVDFHIKNGDVIMQRGSRTVFGHIDDKSLDIAFTAYVSKRIVRIAQIHSYDGQKKNNQNCYHNFERGLENFLVKNMDIDTPTSKPPGYAERHKGYIIMNKNTGNIYYSTYYLHYRVTNHLAIYKYCVDRNIIWPYDIPIKKIDTEHGDLMDYIFDNRFVPPILKHRQLIEKYGRRKERKKEDPYRARDRDFFPSYFDDIINTYRNAFMLDDIIKEGKLETVKPEHSLKYGTEKNFPYSKEKNPFDSYLRDYYSTIEYSQDSTIDSVRLSPQVTVSGNRHFEDDHFKNNSYLMDNYVHPNNHEMNPDEDTIMNMRMYRALIEYNQMMMAEKNLERITTI